MSTIIGPKPRPPRTALDELRRLLYNPNYSSDPDRTLALLNEKLRRAAPLTHADIDRLDPATAAEAVACLSDSVKDRRGDIIARAKKRLLGG